jgi:RNA polymerase sigma factor (sigma-70 family)
LKNYVTFYCLACSVDEVEDINKEIIACIKSRQNEKALSYLYSHTLKKVKGYILKNNGSIDEANDIFQDAVIIFFKAVISDKFDNEHSVDAFIFSISRNLWINTAKRRRKLVHVDIENEPLAENSKSQLEQIISKEKREAINLAYSKLEDTCRKLLGLIAYEKISMKELMVKLNLTSENAAKTMHYRCKQSFHKIIKENADLYNALKP